MKKQDKSNALLPKSTELGKQNIKIIVKNTYNKKTGKKVKKLYQLLSKLKLCFI